jgi:hypothetical protein
VASPRLTALGLIFERAARNGTVPTPDQLEGIERALEAYLIAARAWIERPVAVA